MSALASIDSAPPRPLNGDDGSPGFGIYIHWPFCAAKCPYCDFNSHVRHRPVDQSRFVEAFLREMETMRGWTGPREVTSVFIGGGTPSLMQAGTVGALLEAVDRLWGLPDGIEITMEANPSSVDAGRFRGYRAAGVNRLSLGVQALNDADLKWLGRLHDTDEALKAIALARETFPRLSFDLIYARPGQTPEQWEAELRQAARHAADHMSLYQLTIEDGTPFKALYDAGKFEVPDPDRAADLFELTDAVTAEIGLPAYEVSNHAVPGSESRHNLTYWRYGDYAGIGPGAHGRFVGDGGKRVTITERHPESWAARVIEHGHGVVEEEALGAGAQGDELLLMGLRLVEGVDLARHEMLTGRALDTSRIAQLQEQGLLEPVANSRIRATLSGRLVLNALIAELAA
ncbi:radical SAM family heme chaperone HemW [Oricola cellulosilytica]|uniref:Heme chaperone HemW n=1 Tax=Oricola cellulosilytica TaxID=1429082 RepID=A0A4R0PGW6_9HYPH|nr:radical SAM family heme chaperone HemW [Oricola cellulosilytica]TCD16064.1 coproporphyrinogen III oxidase [Oricola cellulosilytica]